MGVAAVVSTVVPVLYGALRGEVPGALGWLGVAVGVAALFLTSWQPAGDPSRVGVTLGLVSGVFFSAMYIIAISTSEDAGTWPIVPQRLTAFVLAITAALVTRQRPFAGGSATRISLLAGVFGASGVAAVVFGGQRGPIAPVVVEAAQGVDLNPIDIRDPAACERLASFIFADQPDRSERLDRALGIARTYPPQVATGRAADWLAARLAMPAPEGRHRVVLHSMVLQYVGADERAAIECTLAATAKQADAGRPFACIGFEWNAARTQVELRLRSWPDGEDRILAHCHPYGGWFDWKPL